MIETIINLPMPIHLILLTLCVIGAIVAYRFRYLVVTVAIGAIGVWASLKKGEK